MIPITRTLTVPLPPDRAFALFVDRLGDWWPVQSHSISAGSGQRPRAVTVEPHVDGRITEVAADGTAHVWGHLTAYDPPHTLQIAWYVGRGPEMATRVAVRFDPDGDGTKLTLVHDGFEVFGDAAAAVHGQYQPGWDLVLAGYSGAA